QVHSAVKVHPLDALTDDDLRLLWRSAKSQLPAQTDDAVIRLLAKKAQRRTLPTVYAVEDIRTCAHCRTRPAFSIHVHFQTRSTITTMQFGQRLRGRPRMSHVSQRPSPFCASDRPAS